MSRKFTPETAPRNGRVKGSRNRTPPKAILESIVAHACEVRGKERRRRIDQAMDALFISNEAYYAKVAMEASVRLQQIEEGAHLGDGGPVSITVRWVDPKRIDPSHPVPLPPDPIPSSEPPHRGPMVMPRLLNFDRPLDQ